jgi:sugar phosphate isomerase/epimerase
MKLSFMTFVCPEWEMEQAVRFARSAGYDGIEIRVDANHKHGVSSQSTAEERRRVRSLFRDAGVAIPSVATSVRFAQADDAAWQKQIDAAKANLDLAADLGAPVVRIFAGSDSYKTFTDAAADRVAAAFDTVGEYARHSGACPMLECGHDIVTCGAEGASVIRRVTTPNFCVLWNRCFIDDETFACLHPRIRHFHIHDQVLNPDDTSILTLAKRMKAFGYAGYVSLEIIKGVNLPEDQLRETATRLQRQIRAGEGAN